MVEEESGGGEWWESGGEVCRVVVDLLHSQHAVCADTIRDATFPQLGEDPGHHWRELLQTTIFGK